jgi:nicotinate-nucleotide adenylyltransferase
VRIGLFGGSFDPIHQGHVAPVLEAQRHLRLDRVVYLPTASPPHKPERRFAPALSRYAMVELALLDHPDLRVSDHELALDRPSYTVETLEHFRTLHPDGELVLVLGGDSFVELPTWMRWREIASSTELVVLARPGSEAGEAGTGLAPELEAAIAAGRVHFVRNSPHPVSSTEVRRRFAAGEAIPEGWLSPRVVRYIAKYSLYP